MGINIYAVAYTSIADRVCKVKLLGAESYKDACAQLIGVMGYQGLPAWDDLQDDAANIAIIKAALEQSELGVMADITIVPPRWDAIGLITP